MGVEDGAGGVEIIFSMMIKRSLRGSFLMSSIV